MDLPYHPSIPPANVFRNQIVNDPSRAVGLIENYLLTGVLRARTFEFRPGDVLLVSGPCSGDLPVGRALGGLYLLSLEACSRTWTLPWIESRFAGDDSGALEAGVLVEGRRVMRTQMAMAVLDPRRHKGAKFVVVVRHPADLRAAFHKYVRACRDVPVRDERDRVFDFMGRFPTPDAFVDVPVSVCQMGIAAPNSYESFVDDWVREAKNNEEDILIVCYEAFVSNPFREITRMANFLNVEIEEDTIPRAMLAAQVNCGGNNMRLNRTESVSSTTSATSRKTKMTAALRRVSVSASKRMSRKNKSMKPQGFEGFLMLDGEEGVGISSYVQYSSVRKLTTYWESAMGVNTTYEGLYSSIYEEKYPYPQQKPNYKRATVAEGSEIDLKANLLQAVLRARGVTVSLLAKVKTQYGSKRNADPYAETKTVDADLRRDYANSILPPQAFQNGAASWNTSSTLNPAMFASHSSSSLKEDGEFKRDDDEDDVRSGGGCSFESGSAFMEAAKPSQSKFATQEIFEASMLRSTMRQAGMKDDIIKVVAVNSNDLSEML